MQSVLLCSTFVYRRRWESLSSTTESTKEVGQDVDKDWAWLHAVTAGNKDISEMFARITFFVKDNASSVVERHCIEEQGDW